MNTSLLRSLVAAVALLFLVAACASDTGAGWTFAPVAVDEEANAGAVTVETIEDDVASDTAETADASELPIDDGSPDAEVTEFASISTADPRIDTDGNLDAEAPDTETPATPRVIDVVANGAIHFTDTDGETLSAIAVTPGETVVFRVDNTAAFEHAFYIGVESEVSVSGGTTDVGIPPFGTGVQELEWLVPDDVSTLQFACTVRGHYTLMHGTFSISGVATEPTDSAQLETPGADADASEAPADEPDPDIAASEVPGESMTPDEAEGTGEVRTIDIVADGSLRFLSPEGERIEDISVTPGETVSFRVANTANMAHNFYIGGQSELSVPAGMTDIGIPDWSKGDQELRWVVPDDVSELRFACTVPGHYATMNGTFSVSS
jgi:uncharacterized cupredoxin-like copper-binding protein